MQQIINLHLLDPNCGNNSKIELNIIDENYPLLLICPGGGYDHISIRESQPVADRFNKLKYNTAILYYTVLNNKNLIQLNEINTAIKYCSSISKYLILLGFSAGGHLAGLGATDQYSSLVNALILCYPVISFEKYVHLGTRKSFLNNEHNLELNHTYSINNRINSFTPPTYIWTMKTDNSVQYQNTLLLIKALKDNNIEYKSHIYRNGIHGIALADKSTKLNGNDDYINKNIAKWVNEANKFVRSVIKK